MSLSSCVFFSARMIISIHMYFIVHAAFVRIKLMMMMISTVATSSCNLLHTFIMDLVKCIGPVGHSNVTQLQTGGT